MPAIRSLAGRSGDAVRVLLVLAAVALFVLLGRELGEYVLHFARWVDGRGAGAPAAFVAGYAVATVAFVPGALLSLAAGAVFGVLGGALYVFLGATAGSAAAFLIARYLARGAVERRVLRDARFAAIDRAIGREGVRIVLLLRLSPVFPFNLLNYALGLTRVRFPHYLIGSLGMIPGIFLYVYTGRLLGDVAQLAAGAELPRGWGYYLLLAAGFAATLAVAVHVARIARRALREVEP